MSHYRQTNPRGYHEAEYRNCIVRTVTREPNFAPTVIAPAAIEHPEPQSRDRSSVVNVPCRLFRDYGHLANSSDPDLCQNNPHCTWRITMSNSIIARYGSVNVHMLEEILAENSSKIISNEEDSGYESDPARYDHDTASSSRRERSRDYEQERDSGLAERDHGRAGGHERDRDYQRETHGGRVGRNSSRVGGHEQDRDPRRETHGGRGRPKGWLLRYLEARRVPDSEPRQRRGSYRNHNADSSRDDRHRQRPSSSNWEGDRYREDEDDEDTLFGSDYSE